MVYTGNGQRDRTHQFPPFKRRTSVAQTERSCPRVHFLTQSDPLRYGSDPTLPVNTYSGTELQRSLKIRAVIATVARFLCEQCGTIYTLRRSALSVSECPDVKNYKWRLNPV